MFLIVLLVLVVFSPLFRSVNILRHDYFLIYFYVKFVKYKYTTEKKMTLYLALLLFCVSCLVFLEIFVCSKMYSPIHEGGLGNNLLLGADEQWSKATQAPRALDQKYKSDSLTKGPYLPQ